MKYHLNYQQMHKGAKRPSDDEEATVRVEVSSEGGFALLPIVGDFVHIDNSSTDMDSVNGRVRSRLFTYYLNTPSEDNCIINIVIEDTDDDWGALIKK